MVSSGDITKRVVIEFKAMYQKAADGIKKLSGVTRMFGQALEKVSMDYNSYEHHVDGANKMTLKYISKLRQSGRDMVRLAHLINTVNGFFVKQIKIMTDLSAMYDTADNNAMRMEDAFEAIGDAIAPIMELSEPFIELFATLVETNPILATMIGLFILIGEGISSIFTKSLMFIGVLQLFTSQFGKFEEMSSGTEKVEQRISSLKDKIIELGVARKQLRVGSSKMLISQEELDRFPQLLKQLEKANAFTKGAQPGSGMRVVDYNRARKAPYQESRREKLGRKVGGFGGKIKGALGGLKSIVGPLLVIASVLSVFALFGETIQEYFIEPLQDYLEESVLEKLAESMGKLLETLVKLVTENPHILGALIAFADAIANAMDWVEFLLDVLTESPITIGIFTTAFEFIKTIIDGIVGPIVTAIDMFQTLFDMIGSGAEAMPSLASALLLPFEAVFGAIQGLINLIAANPLTGLLSILFPGAPAVPDITLPDQTTNVNVDNNIYVNTTVDAATGDSVTTYAEDPRSTWDRAMLNSY